MKKNSKVKTIKVPLIIFGSILHFVFIIFIMVIFLIGVYPNSQERSKLISDFSPWISDGFCSLLEDEGAGCLHFLNGEKIEFQKKKRPPFLKLLCVYESEMILSAYQNNQTRIIISDFNLNEKEEICSLEGEWYFFNNGEDVVLGKKYNNGWQYCKFDCFSLTFDFTVAFNSDEEFKKAYQQNSSSIKTEDNKYYVSFLNDYYVTLDASVIDKNISELLKKWNFNQHECLLWKDKSLVLTFKRVKITSSSWFLIKYDMSGKSIDKYQFVLGEYKSTNYKIYKMLNEIL